MQPIDFTLLSLIAYLDQQERINSAEFVQFAEKNIDLNVKAGTIQPVHGALYKQFLKRIPVRSGSIQ